MKDNPSLYVRINEYLKKLHFPLNRTCHVTFISSYALTLTSPDEAIARFYKDLVHLIKATPPSDKLMILGDFNTRVGKVSDHWKGVLHPHDVGNLNSNGLLLPSKCTEDMLCITNTIFHQADKYKTTWIYPRSKQWHLIEFVIVKQRDIQDMQIINAMHSAQCWMEHRLVTSILKLCIAPTQHKCPKVIKSSFNTARLRYPYHYNRFWQTINMKL